MYDMGIVVVKPIMYLPPLFLTNFLFFFSGIPILFIIFFANKQYLIERESSHDYSQQSISPFQHFALKLFAKTQCQGNSIILFLSGFLCIVPESRFYSIINSKKKASFEMWYHKKLLQSISSIWIKLIL